jgi:hypothetical protein
VPLAAPACLLSMREVGGYTSGMPPAIQQTSKSVLAPAVSVIDARIIAVRYPQAEEEVQRRMFHGGRLFRIESGPLLSF